MVAVDVVVVGAGVSGVATAKVCIDAKLTTVVVEGSNHVGGLWQFKPLSEGGGGVTSFTHINVSKQNYCFSDFPFPDDVPGVTGLVVSGWWHLACMRLLTREQCDPSQTTLITPRWHSTLTTTWTTLMFDSTFASTHVLLVWQEHRLPPMVNPSLAGSCPRYVNKAVVCAPGGAARSKTTVASHVCRALLVVNNRKRPMAPSLCTLHEM